MMTLTAARGPNHALCTRLYIYRDLRLFFGFWHGLYSHHSAMTDRYNKTCDAVSDPADILGQIHPRDVRLQIYISLTLGVGAFLLFCV